MCGDSVPNLARPGTKDVSFYFVDVCDDTMVGGASPESDAPAGMKHLHRLAAPGPAGTCSSVTSIGAKGNVDSNYREAVYKAVEPAQLGLVG